MYKRVAVVMVLTISVAVGLAATYIFMRQTPGPTPVNSGVEIKLPEPRYRSDVSVEEALLKRRSIRDYTGDL